jgi:hypothetical protein
MADAPAISLKELRGYISDAGELAKGTQIADSGALLNLARHGNKLFCEAKGSGQAPYRVSLIFGEQAGELKARCSCMAARTRPFCKHSAALLVSWARSPESFVVSEAPPVIESTGQKKTVKTGKASGAELMKHGVERVSTLVRELAVAGIAAAGLDRVEQVRQLGEGLRENRLRRLSARTLELSNMLDAATSRRGRLDAVAYADLLSDMLLTARKLEKHLAGEALEDRYVEELIGRTWRKTDRTPVQDVDLVEYAFLSRVTADDYVIRESRFIDLRSGLHYSEKQILPSFMAKRTDPKRSYARTLLSGAAGGKYPGFAPYRLDLETVPQPVPLEPAHVAAIVERAHPSVGAALTAFQEHRRDVFAPDALPLSVRADLVIAEQGRFRMVDAAADALHLPIDSRLDEVLTLLLRRGRLVAVVGDMTLDGILAMVVPMALVIETRDGPDLVDLSGMLAGPPTGRHARPTENETGAAWLEEARRAGVRPAAVALGEVRLEMADALVTGLASLVSRVTEPLVSRLNDLGLDKPAALLAELPAKPDAADRLDGFVKVHQVVGLALVRLASATTIVTSDLERLPIAESIAIRRPSALLTPEELLAARLEGKLSRYEAAWHRGRHFDRLSIDELLEEWPQTWSDGEALPFIVRSLAPSGSRAVKVAREVLGDTTAGQTAQLTAVQVLVGVGGDEAGAVLKEAGANRAAIPLVRARAAMASQSERRGWRAMFPFGDRPPCPEAIEGAIDRLTTARDKEARVAALEEIEHVSDERTIALVRQAWLSDPAVEVRSRAGIALGVMGDSESVEALMAAFRDRAVAVKEAKGALAALGTLGDVRAVPDILRALTENWAGPLPAEALMRVGIPALEPVMTLVVSRPEFAQRKSLQDFVVKLTASKQTERLMSKRLSSIFDAPGELEGATALLKLAAESETLRETVARQILRRIPAPSGKVEKGLARAAQQALEKG